MNITIARIRSNVTYLGPLETVLDSFFENYVKWRDNNPQHNYDTYNVSFGNGRPKRTPETIKWADVIVIPSDSEFRYHGELQMNPKDLAKSESHMEQIRPYFEGKDVIMFRSDRGDTEKLYRNETLKGVNLKSFHTIDEIDFSGNIHGMKYHFISKLQRTSLIKDYSKDKDMQELLGEEVERVFNFSKSEVQRYVLLKRIQQISSAAKIDAEKLSISSPEAPLQRYKFEKMDEMTRALAMDRYHKNNTKPETMDGYNYRILLDYGRQIQSIIPKTQF